MSTPVIVLQINVVFIWVECTHSFCNAWLFYFRVIHITTCHRLLLIAFLSVDYCHVLCVNIPVFGLVCCLSSSCCDTTPFFSVHTSINITQKLLNCVLPVRVLQRVLNDQMAKVDTGGHLVPPLQLSVWLHLQLGPVHE